MRHYDIMVVLRFGMVLDAHLKTWWCKQWDQDGPRHHLGALTVPGRCSVGCLQGLWCAGQVPTLLESPGYGLFISAMSYDGAGIDQNIDFLLQLRNKMSGSDHSRGVPHMAIVNGKTMSFSVESSVKGPPHRPDAGWRWQDHKRWDHTGGLFPTHPVVVDDHFSVAEKDGQKMMFYRGSRLFWETSIYDQRNFTTSLRGFQCQVWVDIWLPGLLHDLNHYLSKL